MKRWIFSLMFIFLARCGSLAIDDNFEEGVEIQTPSTLESIPSEVKAQDETPIEITEKMFLTQINDVFYNFEDYEGQLLRVEGMYESDVIEGKEYHVVYRLGPGCCGNDGWGGFLLNYEGEWPDINNWIEVEGTPRIVKEESLKWLYLDVTSLKVKEERGAETVFQ